MPLSSTELMDAQRQMFDATHKVVMRPTSVPSDTFNDATELSLEYNGLDYEVISILENDALHNEATVMLVKRRDT